MHLPINGDRLHCPRTQTASTLSNRRRGRCSLSPFPASCLLLCLALAHALPAGPPPLNPTFSVLSSDPGPWPQILSSISLQPHDAASAGILVIRGGSPAPAHLMERVEQGAFLILEGESTAADSFGFRATKDRVAVINVEDVHRPKLPII